MYVLDGSQVSSGVCLESARGNMKHKPKSNRKIDRCGFFSTLLREKISNESFDFAHFNPPRDPLAPIVN